MPAALLLSACASTRGALGRETVLEDRDMAWSIAISPDSKQVAVVHLGAKDFLLTAYSIEGKRQWQVALNASEFDVEAVEFSPDGKWVATGGRAGLKILEAENGSTVSEPSSGSISAIAWDENGRDLYFATEDGEGFSWKDVSSETGRFGSRLAPVHGPHGPIRALAFQGGRLYSGGWDKVVDVWERADDAGKLELHKSTTIPVGFLVNDLDVTPDGRSLVAALSRRPPTRTPEVRARELRGELEPPNEGNCAARIDVASARVLTCIPRHHGPVTTSAISPNGARLASAGWDRDVLMDEGGITRVLQLGWAARRVRFSRDGRYLAIAAWTPQNATGQRSAPSALLIELEPRP